MDTQLKLFVSYCGEMIDPGDSYVNLIKGEMKHQDNENWDKKNSIKSKKGLKLKK